MKQLLYLIAAFLLGLATYFFIDTALTTYRLQIKAVTICNLLNTPTETWWSINPLKIACTAIVGRYVDSPTDYRSYDYIRCWEVGEVSSLETKQNIWVITKEIIDLLSLLKQLITETIKERVLR